MTKNFFLLPILLTAFSISAQTRTDKLLKNLHDNESKYIFVIAHRGDWRNAPENSLQSIEKAIAMKVDMIELDIQPTKDGNFICMHDETLDRTSTGKGPIKDYTTEELKKFVLRSGNGIKTRQPIPTLKEALNVCKGRILVNIDKGGTYIKEIMPIIQECGMEKQVIIKGYYPVEKVKKSMAPMKACFICLSLIYGIKKQLPLYKLLSKTLPQLLTNYASKMMQIRI